MVRSGPVTPNISSLEYQTMEKVKNPVILCVIHHRQNHLESNNFIIYILHSSKKIFLWNTSLKITFDALHYEVNNKLRPWGTITRHSNKITHITEFKKWLTAGTITYTQQVVPDILQCYNHLHMWFSIVALWYGIHKEAKYLCEMLFLSGNKNYGNPENVTSSL
jgi:hypothetical protein